MSHICSWSMNRYQHPHQEHLMMSVFVLQLYKNTKSKGEIPSRVCKTCMYFVSRKKEERSHHNCTGLSTSQPNQSCVFPEALSPLRTGTHCPLILFRNSISQNKYSNGSEFRNDFQRYRNHSQKKKSNLIFKKINSLKHSSSIPFKLHLPIAEVS